MQGGGGGIKPKMGEEEGGGRWGKGGRELVSNQNFLLKSIKCFTNFFYDIFMNDEVKQPVILVKYIIALLKGLYFMWPYI